MGKFKNVSEIYKETQDFNGPSEETTKKPFDRAKKYLDKLETMDYVYEIEFGSSDESYSAKIIVWPNRGAE